MPMGNAMPQMEPMAMPVKAECPSASEKKLMLPVTTWQLSSPSSGQSTRMPRRAFFINSIVPGCAHSKGSRDTI